MKSLLRLILLILRWPLALRALELSPIVWILLLPFRILGIAVTGVLELLWHSGLQISLDKRGSVC